MELEKLYEPQKVESDIYQQWENSGAFRSTPDDRPHAQTYTIVIPPPNVTGALHLGHALNNTLQDMLVRYHRMRGFNTLWQPGCDHAGIATQAVVERRIRETEGLSRHDIGREELVRRIWEWKEEYEKRILSQLKLMGCSCDWERSRFTLDDGLAKAVRLQFFNLFKDGLIFRGKRLVNWDTELQTAVANDEVYHETIKGKFWHFKYPVIDPQPGEPEFVIIATTRPETMLGDTAVAVSADPEGELNKAEQKLLDSLSEASEKDKPGIQAKIDSIIERRETHLPQLITLAKMANADRKLRLPLVDREIPLITDQHANPTLGSGCVKITPAHDPNDYEVGMRQDPPLPMINVLTRDGKIAIIVETDGSENPNSKKYEGLTFAGEGRDKVVADLDALELVHDIEDRAREVGHSDRSKAPIEPFLSDQWFVKTGDVDGDGVLLANDNKVSGIAQAAIDTVRHERINIFPTRYAKSYVDWLGEKRDWCISRQLWWGHRIPVWTFRCGINPQDIQSDDQPISRYDQALDKLEAAIRSFLKVAVPESKVAFLRRGQLGYNVGVCTTDQRCDDALLSLQRFHENLGFKEIIPGKPKEPTEARLVGFPHATETGMAVSSLLLDYDKGLTQDEDVLDTWFSSALWPFSTLGWPEQTSHLKQYYPGSVLITSRDIITNWVARMVMFGLYAIGKVPFDHVYIHPKILDGRGETMSKSKGNGVDPVDIIHTHGADALRYAMADMTTETQDIRMPVEYICPHCEKLVDQSLAIKAEEQSRKSRGIKLDRKLQPSDCHRVKCLNKECGKEFSTKWADEDTRNELKTARETSDKFDLGRNFCNKLWNAARYAFMNIEGAACNKLDPNALLPEDRWILSTLSQTIRAYHQALQLYQFSASIKILREFFWENLCNWYIELTKPRLTATTNVDSSATAKQVLAFCMDQMLRLFHPTLPFITERLWQQLNEIAPKRGLPGIAELNTDSQLIVAEFPPVEGYASLEDEAIVNTFSQLQDATRGVRDLRTQCKVVPKDRVTVTIALPADDVSSFESHAHIVTNMAGIGSLTVDPSAKRPSNAASVNIQGLRIYVHDVSDDAAERKRTTKTLDNLEKQIKGKQSKLGNEKFVANAPPEVITVERERLEEMLTQQKSLQSHLAELG